MFKGDREAAYKQVPLAPRDLPFAIIALRRPVSGKWYGLRSKSWTFGAIAGVWHYNVFSRLATAIFTRLFGIPMVFFFDYFAAIATGFWPTSL